MKKIIYIFIFLLCFSASYSTSDRKILVIHSYHHGLDWEDNISEGIKSVFDSEDYEIFFEYLDGKRNYGDEYFKSLALMYKQKSNAINFEAIMVCDNVALDFITKYSSYFPKIPIVFCGINNFNKDMVKDHTQISGITEQADHKKNIELILKLHKDVENILIINDNTVTGKAVKLELEEIIPNYTSQVNIEMYSDFSLKRLKEKLRNINSQTVIYLLVLNRDNKGKYISYNDGVNMVAEESNVPIYGAWNFYLGKGIVGGRILTGYLHGVEAGKLLKNVINNKDKDYNGYFIEGESKYFFDYNQMKRFNISKSSLPKGSVIINNPENLFYKYQFQILVITYLFMVILVINIFYKKKTQTKLVAMVNEKTIHLERANKELERISNVDGLTQLFNRRYFDENLKDLWKELQREKKPFSILMIDVDFFKKFNDIYGHMAGDDCLKELSRVLFRSVGRPSDTVSRYGGEEFSVLVKTDAEGAKKIAEWILEEVVKLRIPHEGSQRGIVTVSIGIGVAVPSENWNSGHLLDVSDQALYESKNSGRNKYTLKFLG